MKKINVKWHLNLSYNHEELLFIYVIFKFFIKEYHKSNPQ